MEDGKMFDEQTKSHLEWWHRLSDKAMRNYDAAAEAFAEDRMTFSDFQAAADLVKQIHDGWHAYVVSLPSGSPVAGAHQQMDSSRQSDGLYRLKMLLGQIPKPRPGAHPAEGPQKGLNNDPRNEPNRNGRNPR